jgi:hypothetical protein
MSFTSSTSIARVSANIATALFAVVIVLQLLIAAGVLPISMAWGGRQSVLTPGLRLASLASVVILGLFAYVIRRRAGLLGPEGTSTVTRILAWFVTAYQAFNTVTNLTSQSLGEKILSTPLTLILTVACLVVSISRN